MTPRKLRQFLAATIAARRPVLISGAPGLGKSEIVESACTDAGADLILSHPAVSDPTDAKGLPWLLNGLATFMPFGDLRRAIEAVALTIWFLDDLGQATPAVQAAFMQLILARRVNGHKISDHVVFVAATNRRTDRAGVSGILEPVKSRFMSIVELTADVDAWCEWALDHGVPAELIAFIRFKPDLLSAFVPSNDLVNSPSPRTWFNASRIMAMDLPADIRHEALAGAVGEGAATEYLAFERMLSQLPSVDAVLASPATAPIPDSPSALATIAAALAHRANTTTIDRIAQYITRLLADHAEFASLCYRDVIRRQPELLSTAPIIRLQSGPLGQIVSGGVR